MADFIIRDPSQFTLTLDVAGNFTVATNKLQVNATSGALTLSAGITGCTSLAMSSDLTINTDKFLVTGATGAVAFEGDLTINSTYFVVTAATGAVAFPGSLTINTDKFAVDATSGDVTFSGAATGVSSLTLSGDITCNTSKFAVTGATGAVAFDGDLTINTNKFNVSASSGAVAFLGNLTVNTDKFVVTASTGDVSCNVLTASSVVIPQLKTNNSITISDDGVTYTSLTNAPTTGAVYFAVHCHTADNAAGLWVATKASETGAGAVNKLSGANGSTSTTGLSAEWATGAVAPSVKFSASWGGGISTAAAYCTILMVAT